MIDLNIMTTENEEYDVYLYFEGGMSLHQLRYRTNLYDNDGLMEQIHLYDDDGHYVLSAYFDRNMARYDMSRNAILIPSSGIKIKNAPNDDDDDDENRNGNEYLKRKPLYMTFKKRAMKNLHYMI